MASCAQQDRTHAEQVCRHDIQVDAVADHDAFVRFDAKVLTGTQEQAHVGLAIAVDATDGPAFEVANDTAHRELFDDRGPLVGRQPESQATRPYALEHVHDTLAQLEDVSLRRLRFHPFGDASGLLDVAARKLPDQRAVQVGRKALDGASFGVSVRLARDYDALTRQPSAYVCIDCGLVFHLDVEGPANVEEHGADH